MIYDYLLKYGFKPNNIGLNYLADIINLGIKGENLEPLSRVGYKLIADKYKKNIATIEKIFKTASVMRGFMATVICFIKHLVQQFLMLRASLQTSILYILWLKKSDMSSID